MKQMTKDWLEYADRDYLNAEALIKVKRYHGALLFYQQSVEKTLKAYLIENMGEKIPFVHDIRYLLKNTGLSMDELEKLDLKELSLVYTRIRYPDMDRKHYSNISIVHDLISQFQILYVWIQKQFKNK